MSETYDDRMIRPPAGVAPTVTFVREGNRLIPIPSVPVQVSVSRRDEPELDQTVYTFVCNWPLDDGEGSE